ncbi:MAG: potassium-transporting ATPase subunit KdpA [Glaciimonas sp.]|nr:potassium-transporting ATPase subunit KdpA [Glaciimonas sp.]
MNPFYVFGAVFTLALVVQNFFSAATGIAIAFALIPDFSRYSSQSVGNFWRYMTWSTLYLLLPFSLADGAGRDSKF